jgi:tetratricopeptide (TPR) repeat protein
MSCNQFDDAVDAFQKSLALFESLGHLPGQAITYDRLSGNYAEKYKLGQALDYALKALRLYSQLDYRTRLSVPHYNLAVTYTLLGSYDRAFRHAQLGLEIARQQTNKIDEARMLARLARIEDRLGKPEEAEENYHIALAALRKLKLHFDLSYALLGWGDFQLRAGRLDEAEKTFDEALAINNDMEHLRLTTQSKLAMVYLAQGKTEQALAFASEMWQAVEPKCGQGLPFPIETMFECVTIFQACNDARAKNALDQAADVLKRTADGIEDPEMREAFLNNVPVNRSLQQAMHNPLR